MIGPSSESITQSDFGALTGAELAAHVIMTRHRVAPGLDGHEWPEPADGDEDNDPLYNSTRSYVEQIDRYKRHQGKPTTGVYRRPKGQPALRRRARRKAANTKAKRTPGLGVRP